jgi:hypothetical protein
VSSALVDERISVNRFSVLKETREIGFQVASDIDFLAIADLAIYGVGGIV